MLSNLKYIANFLLEAQKKGSLICILNLSVKYSKITFIFLNILQNEGFIIGYRKNPSEKSCYVYLKYYLNKPAIKFIEFYGYKTNPIYINKRKLYFNINNNKGSTYIISTNRGLITGKLAMSYNSGGLLVCKIN